MKNNIFDINRFGLLAKKRFLDTKSTTTFEVLGVAAVLAIILGITAMTGEISLTAQQIIYAVGMAFLGIVYADAAFSDLKDKTKGMFYLSTPASHFEKLVNAILFTSILFPIVYTVLFFTVDGLFFAALGGSGLVKMGSMAFFEWDQVLQMVRPFLIMQSVFMLGSIWFGKRSLLKTSVAIVAYYAMLSIVGVLIFKLMIDDSALHHNVNINVSPNELISKGLVEVVLWMLIPFFWVVTYFTLSEKQL